MLLPITVLLGFRKTHYRACDSEDAGPSQAGTRWTGFSASTAFGDRGSEPPPAAETTHIVLPPDDTGAAAATQTTGEEGIGPDKPA